MSITIIKHGVADSIQDLGRFGYQYMGINATGSMDFIACSIANLLVGNNSNEAVLEIHFPSSVILFNHSTIIALSGADFGAMINDIPIPINHPIIVQKNVVLQFTNFINGRSCYLAVRGGFILPKWLNSYSTNFFTKTGGFKGRHLQKNDVINFNPIIIKDGLLQDKDAKILPWKCNIQKLYLSNKKILFLKGASFEELDEPSVKILLNNKFQITAHSNRMGYHLQGKLLHQKKVINQISSAVTKGTVQLLPNGQLIILMADHQTTGGYPKIGHVIQAAIPSLAQLSSNSLIEFEETTIEKAEQLLCEQYQYLLQLQNACNLRLQEFITTNEIN